MDGNTIVVGDFNIPFSATDRSCTQKINKEMTDLNTTDQTDSIEIYESFQPTAEEYTFFSRTQGTFSRIDCMLDHKTILTNERLKSHQVSFLTTKE